MTAGRQTSAAHAAPGDDAPLSGLHILVVDDQEDARYLVARVLEDAGAEVSQAESVVEAVGLLADQPFAVLVSDIGMPIEDGYDLIRRVRSAQAPEVRELPAIAVTAFCSPADRSKAFSAGFQEHLGKPVDMRALLTAVVRLGRRPVGPRAV